MHGPIAQWLERRPVTAEVAGSSPVRVAGQGVNAPCSCGCRPMVRTPVFQTGDAGSIPVIRSGFHLGSGA